MKKYNVLGVCAGNGVLLYPFEKDEAFNVLGNIEPRAVFHTQYKEQWKANFKGFMSKGHIVTPRIDILVGHPDCGHSSQMAFSRAKKLTDPMENDSFQLFINEVQKKLPKVFLMENLPKLLRSVDLNKAFPGYYLKVFEKVSMSEFGNSQKSRVRLVVIGVRDGYNRIRKIIKTHLKEGIKPVNEPQVTSKLLKGLENENPLLGHVREDIDTIISIYARTKMSLKEIQKVWHNEFKNSKKWPIYNSKMSSAPGVYRNFANSFPMTVRKANRQFNPNGLQMSPRELACIQGIPDSFVIHMDLKRKNYWINKGRATVAKTPPYELGFWFYLLMKQIL